MLTIRAAAAAVKVAEAMARVAASRVRTLASPHKKRLGLKSM